MTSCESKASPSRSAWTSFMALSCRRFLMLEKMDSFHVSNMSWEHRRRVTARWSLKAKGDLAWSSPYERCCPQHWTSCCFPVCPSEWSPAGKRVWAGCRTVWRTSSTPRCTLWATPCRPDDSTHAETETNTADDGWRWAEFPNPCWF